MHASAPKGKMVWLWFTLAGVAGGYALLHPFAMLAYILDPQHAPVPLNISLWGRQVRLAFSAEMLAMGGAFVFMGGVAGFCLGAWYLQKERWVVEKLESQRRLTVLETRKELMVTLAHHIRNANVVIGGFSTRLQKHLSDPEIKQQLEMIHQASREIEAVIASLESLSEIDHTQHIGAWATKMIDLKQELAARLKAAGVAKDSHGS